MSIKPVDLVAFDLDGTILNDEKKVSSTDWQTLVELGAKNILRVVATGRNHFSLIHVLPADFPADFVVFSSGAGIMHWPSKKILYCQHMETGHLKEVVRVLINYRLNFTVHLPIPNNHHILLHAAYPNAENLLSYVNHYKDFVSPLVIENLPSEATQLIVLLNGQSHLFYELKQQFPFVKTILTTSPIDHKTLWMEIFHPAVSKANGLKWICNHLKNPDMRTFGIGNDFNDWDLLNHTHHSFVVSNAPNEMKTQFRQVTSNNESGFSQAILEVFKN
ncbi:MAG: hypothetical protein A2W95_15280 [Bacteroidetes bacterium GWA2_40_14]|nr:MAG: hypothetical protein A2W95_15280 [Bacteroidetes bacterium GWA2_40_14]HAZ01863.1 hypothetical protein [Marinilabiliales bacterium]